MSKWEIIWHIVLGYGLTCIIVYIISPLFIFLPPKPTYQDNDQIIKINTSDGRQISAIYLHDPNAKYTLLYSHGNAEDMGLLMPIFSMYHKLGFSILAYDYHGYGTSDGWYSETNTYRDITAAYQYLTSQAKVKPEEIILFGRSLGVGPTIHLAAKHTVAGVILESPFLTAFRTITQIPIFPLDRYRNNKLISKVKAPMLIFHGVNDEVIPFWHGKRIFALANDPKHFVPVAGAGHNDVIIVMGDQYAIELMNFIAGL